MIDEESAELYSSWRRHPVTEALMASFQRDIETAKQRWLDGNFTDESNASATFLIQAREQERARVYRSLIDMTAEEFLQQVGES